MILMWMGLISHCKGWMGLISHWGWIRIQDIRWFKCKIIAYKVICVMIKSKERKIVLTMMQRYKKYPFQDLKIIKRCKKYYINSNLLLTLSLVKLVITVRDRIKRDKNKLNL